MGKCPSRHSRPRSTLTRKGTRVARNSDDSSVLLDDLDQCAAIEAACYGPEGATRERIAYRIATYPEGSLIAELEGRAIGFVNSSATDKDDISNEAFKDLIGQTPAGRNFVIFSLAVHPDFQRHGIGRLLMEVLIATAG